MSRAKLFNMIKSRGEQPNGRNAFDLSNWHGYTSNIATIQPLKSVFTVTDDYFEVNVSDMAQNISPMNTAAPLSAQRELCAYFVPHNFIWHNYNQYQATREDPDSSVMQTKGIAYEPRFITYDLYLQAVFFFSEWLNTLVIRRGRGYATMKKTLVVHDTKQYLTDMDYLSAQFGEKEYAFDSDDPTENDPDGYIISYDDLGDFNLLSSNMFRGRWVDTHAGNLFYNKDIFFDVVGQWKWCDVLRKLDMFGYGNLYPLFDQVIKAALANYDNYVSWVDENYGTLSLDELIAELADYRLSLSGSIKSLVTRLKQISVRLDTKADYANITSSSHFELSQCKRLKVYPLFGYNHVFYNMFRNTYRDLDYHVRNYNCDFVDCSSLAGCVIHMQDLPVRFLNLETHQWKKDMFTALLPDMQIGAVQGISMESITESDYGRWTTSRGGALGVGYDVQTDDVDNSHQLMQSLHGSPVSGIRHTHQVSSSFDVLALRRAEALQQYYMDLMRAGNRTEDIFKQIYGKAPKSEEHKTPYFVDAVTSPLSVNPILATADTGNGDNGNLGDIAARAMVQSKTLSFKFSTHDFGCLIFLSFMSVDSAYNSYRIDPHLMNLSPEANFIPQLMNLGYEWLTRESLNNLKIGIEQDQPLGCAPRYIEFKTDIDLVHGNLVDAVDINDSEVIPGIANFDVYEGSLNIWAVTRTDMQQENEVSLRNFYQDPRVVNNIFKTQKSALEPSYESDQFICFTNIKIDAIRQFSELGLPRFV